MTQNLSANANGFDLSIQLYIYFRNAISIPIKPDLVFVAPIFFSRSYKVHYSIAITIRTDAKKEQPSQYSIGGYLHHTLYTNLGIICISKAIDFPFYFQLNVHLFGIIHIFGVFVRLCVCRAVVIGADSPPSCRIAFALFIIH